MGLATSTPSTALPVAAAISLACATFGAVERAHADESAIKTSHTSEQRFSRHDLHRLESFAHFLARNDSWLPPLHERSRIFDLLTVEGVFSSVTPLPLEQAALQHLASTDASTLRFRILSARVRTKDTFSKSDMFGEAPKQVPPQSLHLTDQLSKEDARHYGQALAFCHLISGHISIASTNGAIGQEETYL